MTDRKYILFEEDIEEGTNKITNYYDKIKEDEFKNPEKYKEKYDKLKKEFDNLIFSNIILKHILNKRNNLD